MNLTATVPAGSIDVTVKNGATARDVLVQAARLLAMDEAMVERLAPVLDSRPIQLDDEVPAGATQLTGAPQVSNG